MPYTDKAYRKFRESETWKRMAKAHLETHPTCERCNAQPASRCRQPRWTHGDEWEHHDPGSLEAVCDESSRAASAEDHAAYHRDVDADGYPLDPRHPANKHR